MARYVAAIDQGTTSTRCIVFDHGGRVVALDQLEHRQIFPRPGWVEHDPVEIWENTRRVVAGALARADLVPEDVGFCVVVQDLREHNERLTKSPLVKALGKSAIGKIPELQQVQALDQLFQKQFDIDLGKIRDDVLGDAIVFAYRPGPPGRSPPAHYSRD